MKKVNAITSKILPIARKEIDTDLIIPAQFLTSISKEGYGKNLFIRLRESDPQFPLNLPQFAGAKIIVADANFGCGSSREHAVWTIMDAGFDVVIAPSFADIFYSNSAKNGLLLVTLPSDVVEGFLVEGRTGQFELTVDLESQQVVTPTGDRHAFSYDPFRKHCMMNGLDDLDYLLSHGDKISQFRNLQQTQRFFSTLVENNPQ